MLKNTFIHLPGVGSTKERALWEHGILTWDDFERAYLPQPTFFSTEDGETAQGVLTASRKALATGDMDFFAERLPKREHYRIALTQPEATYFLDIETTGLSQYYDKITLIGAGINNEYICYIKGTSNTYINSRLSSAKCLVTFNGTVFDLKFIKREFPNMRLPKAHVDLRFLARRVGLSGGQKKIEKEVGFGRDQDIEGLVGENAPILWHKYRLGDRDSARRLIGYNHADIEGMKAIFDVAVSRVVENEGGPLSTSRRYRFSPSARQLTWASTKTTARRNRIYVPRFTGRRGPAVTYQQLAEDRRTAQLRVVGIDLSGSEKRPAGWCLLDGDCAHTKKLSTDLEILVETQKVRPDLISIDSPLSLPKGRVTAWDSDPGRAEFGIMRECERILLKRRVGIYPSLIPSMQGLTARGIRLARAFRELGFPVIESYPGAAQDIMGIPRKRAGLNHLKKGLADFGIVGEFLTDSVSHDEADAITSAVVGVFFWSGKFEALGNPEEEYLIIPDLHVSPAGWRSRKVIGISGPIAAGKTTAATYLEKRKFAYGRFSQVLEAMLRKQKKRITRRALQAFGEQVRHDPGQRWLCRTLVDGLPETENLAIDGLRHPEDHAYLAERFGPAFMHIHVQAPESVRRTRYEADGFTAKQFEVAEAHPVEEMVGYIGRLAHEVIANQATIGGFTSKLIRAIRSPDSL